MSAMRIPFILFGVMAATAACAATMVGTGEVTVFRRAAEPREGAFSLLVPAGWQVTGGIVRVDPNWAGGPAQSIEAKVDLTVQSDDRGTVMMRRYPDWYRIDMRGMPAGQMGLFPAGSNYQGMVVSPCPDPETYLLHVHVPQVHPQASDLRVERRDSLDGLVREYRQRLAQMALPMEFQYDGVVLTLTYREGGTLYRERLLTIIENRGAMAGGQWANRETTSFRAPAEDYVRWEPVFHTMCGSVQLAPAWLAGELRGQLTRAGIAMNVQQEIQRLDQQILEHQRTTNAEIQNDMFLNLTGQEEYVNPWSGETEIGTDQLGQYRWEAANGDVLYGPTDGFDPNADVDLGKQQWKRSAVRERRP